MTGFLGFFRSEKVDQRASTAKQVPNTGVGNASPSPMRIELIRVVLQATLKKTGIPASWIGCDVVPLTRDGNSEVYHTTLVIKKWNEDLLCHVWAFEQELRGQLTRFDPLVKQSEFAFSWKISSECGCPYPSMPGPEFWTPEGSPEKSTRNVPAPRPDTKFDISDADYNHKSSGFAPTEPGGLN